MTSLEIRLAERQNLLALFQMIQALAAYEKISEQVLTSLPELEETLFSKQPKAYAYIAFADKQAAGYVLLVPCIYIKRNQAKLFIEDFYVDENYRGHGVGKQLMQTTIDFARRNNYFKIEWGVYNWNHAAQQFYERMGAEPASTWTSYQFIP
jgi:GNAT superfamily N-acetyltransferase